MVKAGADLAAGSVSRHLLKLTIPMFLGISSMIVAAMIDTIYVGWLGTLELAAVSFTFPVVMALSTLPMGIGIGAASIIARVVGAGDESRVRRLASDSLLLVVLIVLAATALGYIFVEPLFRILGAAEDTLPLSVSYMRIWFIGLPAFALPMVAINIMRAVGNARLPGVIMAVGAGMQVCLAPLFIFGIPGWWPGLGFEGAALGFVISRIITFGYTVYVLRAMHLLSFEHRGWRKLIESWREILRIGLPAMMSNLIGPVSMGVIVAMLADYGHIVVAGFGVASRIEALAIMILMALAASTGPFVGQNWGAGKFDRIYRVQKLGYRFSHLWALVAFVVLAGAGRWIIGLINDDPGVIEATYAYLLLVPITYGFLGIGMVAGSTFIALGKPLPTLILSISRMIIIYIPLALLLEIWFGYRGIFAAAAVCNVIMGWAAVTWVKQTLGTQIRRSHA